MTKKIAHIILFACFTIFVANYAINEFNHLKKDSITSVEEQIEEQVSNEGDNFLTTDFFIFQNFIRTISLFSFDLEDSINTDSFLSDHSPNGFHTAAYIDLCVFRI